MEKSNNSRCNWSHDETQHLLDKMKENKVMNLLDGKTRRNNNIYNLLSKELAKKGFIKNSEQVKLKFRTLKQKYNKIKRLNNKSGSSRLTMQHFADLEELLGDRPVAAAEGLDTIEMEEDDTLNETIAETTFSEETGGAENVAEEVADVEPLIKTHTASKRQNATQTTLLQIAADITASHQSTLQLIKEENAAFLNDQRGMYANYLQETKVLMEEDRKATKEMLVEILNNFN